MDGGEEFTGRTVDEAKQRARAEYGPDARIEVLSQGTRGVFGIGAEPARVVALPPVSTPASTREPEDSQISPTPESLDDRTRSALAVETELEADEDEEQGRPAERRESRDLEAEATEVLGQLLSAMGFEADITVQSRDEPLTLAVHGENLGVLIGRRGDNLSALQFMVNLILSKHRRQWPRVVLDIENYRVRREESLRTLADRMAYRVQRNGRPFTLEAMPASDRRIIHLALRDSPDLETYSIGEGPARRVVIAPKRDNR